MKFYILIQDTQFMNPRLNIRAVLCFRGELPWRADPFRLNTRTAPPPSDQIPEIGYALQSKRQVGVNLLGRYTRAGSTFRSNTMWQSALSRPTTMAFCSFGSETMAAPLTSDQIPGQETPFRSVSRRCSLYQGWVII